MTTQEFDQLQFTASMKIKHTCPMTGLSRMLDVVSVNFAEHTIGVKDDETIECEHCGKEIEVLTWLSCENCELLTSKPTTKCKR